MTGHEQRPRVLAERRADGPAHRRNFADGLGKMAVGGSLAGLGFERGFIDAALEWGREIPIKGGVGKVFGTAA